ncbi:2-oxo-4-hydroxy-4-carboxy-5-ureidoimidazoline decarboxylase [Sphingomonas sp. BIUV-7]|uniref:2-oxo-4-hydroxy-4-carboxy-5-ureidoimidazoline decarboxylase n=1 Tax=Sphingomonas natans TaxID=3063330 RepID=A0ABT8Y6L2_9SPHN|nr:2-oxo-4-hydroxy-4-carboxy-5-ureidoimidazoline decarboxylase [Sphingomonas sp. BIUV-7]MDO6413958.1 2-oxo-4-hydroxy-4-carboxy-5-ureidoimidazoline decarboxylase [Sphingomonas sp. BIUV-7]
MTIDEINALDAAGFVAKFGFLFEHSPWIVREAEARRPFADIAAMEAAMADIVTQAPHLDQLKLLRAHPELASKAAVDKTLTQASNAEQASAGLDRLTQDEYDLFHDLNRRYRERFGFPFIICVRLADKAQILAAMRERLGNTEDYEIETAIGEIGRIVHLRLKDVLG